MAKQLLLLVKHSFRRKRHAVARRTPGRGDDGYPAQFALRKQNGRGYRVARLVRRCHAPLLLVPGRVHALRAKQRRVYGQLHILRLNHLRIPFDRQNGCLV